VLAHMSERRMPCCCCCQVRLVELPEGAGSLSVTRSLLGEHVGRYARNIRVQIRASRYKTVV
jgi:hypothetical protein